MTRIYIFDTTLRDGEQSPGCSMNKEEKLEVARQLERLGVDVIEAGFAISSKGDFDSIDAIARESEPPSFAACAGLYLGILKPLPTPSVTQPSHAFTPLLPRPLSTWKPN